jgi:hypothetical protein
VAGLKLIPLTQKYMTAQFWLGTGTSIKCDGIKIDTPNTQIHDRSVLAWNRYFNKMWRDEN